jgi:replicative DNA helicase
MPSLSSKTNERRLLALLMKSPTHMRALSLNLDVFATPKYRKAAELIKKYVKKYKSPPSKSAIKRYASKLVKNDIDAAEEVVTALSCLQKLPKVQKSDAGFEFEQAENYRTGRALLDVVDAMQQKFEQGDTDYIKMRKTIIADLLETGSNDSNVVRGKIFDKAKERFKEYEAAERGDVGDVIPFGIKPLDEKLGGMKKTSVTLMYSKTGGGKTRTAVNVAYNAAVAGYNVMYFSLEMGFNLLASCFDSRMAWVDGNEIVFGKLNKKNKKRYFKALKKQLKEKLNVWIVDVSMGAVSSMVLEEIELYKAANGVSPDLVVIDYANLMEPTKRYNGRSEKYDFLFKEYHEIAKYCNVAILTATQESRDASKADIEAKKKKQEVEQGVHNIGLSNYMAPHCESVIRLKQDSKDLLQNRLWGIIDKNRYGTQGQEIPLMAIWSKNYVGDRLVTGNKVYKLKKRQSYQEELAA